MIFNNIQNKSKYLIIFAFIYFCIYIFIYNFCINMSFGDDIDFFEKQLMNISFLEERYKSWTSRVLIEILVVFFAKNEFAFRLCNIIVMFSVPALICRCLHLRHIESIIISVLCFSFYDISIMQSAGVRATFINYFWPLAALLSAHVLLQTWLQQSRVVYLLTALPILIFACNCEQVCLIAFLIYGFATLLYWIKKNRAYKICLLYSIIAIIELIVIIICPGNYARIQAETFRWMQPFADFNMFEKIYIGITATINRYFFKYNLIIIIILSILVLLQNKRHAVVFTLFPLISTICIFIVSNVSHQQILQTEHIVNETSLSKSSPRSLFVEQEYYQFLAIAKYTKQQNDGQIRSEVLRDIDRYVSEEKMAMAVKGFSAWEHYRKFGGKECINPSNAFDATAYLDAKVHACNLAGEKSPDGSPWTRDMVCQCISDAGMTPLEHYLYFAGTGKGEVPSGMSFPVPESLKVHSPESLKVHSGVDPYDNFFFHIAFADIWPTIWSAVMCVLLLLTLRNTVAPQDSSPILFFIIAVGFCSRIILGFSPTLYASADRTFLFLDFAIIAVCTVLSQRIRYEGLCLLALLSVVHTTQQLLNIWNLDIWIYFTQLGAFVLKTLVT